MKRNSNWNANLHLLLVVLLSLTTNIRYSSANGNTSANSNSNANINPYKVLGIEKETSQDDIRKSYRKLCLKYHPDKNVHREDEDRAKCEDTFKAIQEANSLIGTSEARKQYESSLRLKQYQQRFNGNGAQQTQMGRQHHPNHPFNSNPFGRTSSGSRGYNFPQRRRFYVNGIDISQLFSNNNNNNNNNNSNNNPFFPNSFFDNPASTNNEDDNSPKSVFIQKVTVSLEELYSGVRNKEFQFKDGFFKPYRAAIKGGIAIQLALQGLMTSVPLLLRTSWPVGLFVFLLTFHVSLPRTSRIFYSTKIKRGWKAGTKLIFKQPGIDVVFVLDEGKHDRFVRDGNDLKTTATIGQTKAAKGCTILIDPLGVHELPIMVKLKKGEVTHDRYVVEVKGRGWPQNDGKRGNLLVTIKVVSDAKAKRANKIRIKRRGN